MRTTILNKNYLILPILLATLAGCGKASDSSAPAASSEAAASAAPTDNNYVTGADLRFSGGVVPKGTSVTMLESKFDTKLGSLVHLGVDSDDESLPSDIWVSSDDLSAAQLDKVEEGDYSDSNDLNVDGFDARRRGGGKRRGGGGMTYCYRYVKQYLIKIGKVSTYLPGASAYMAASILPKYGFHQISGGPSSAQINDVCVYRGGRGGNGHAEVKVSGGWYYGYGIIGHAMQNHPLIGCFRK